MTALLDLVNWARQMRPEEVTGWIKGNSVKRQRKKWNRETKKGWEPIIQQNVTPKKPRKKKVWHWKLLTASFYTNFRQRIEHLIKRWNVQVRLRDICIHKWAMTSTTVLGAFVWVFAASMRDRDILGGTGLKHQWDYTRNEHYPEYPYSDVITWHGKLPAQSGFAPTLPRRAADIRKSWDLFLGWFSWVWLRAKLHGKAELSVLLFFKHDFKKLTALSFMSRPCLWNSFKSITREQRDPRECGVPGSAVSPSQTVNSQEDPGTKPTSSERHRKQTRTWDNSYMVLLR